MDIIRHYKIIIGVIGIAAIIIFGIFFYSADDNNRDVPENDNSADTASFNTGLDAQINNEGVITIIIKPLDKINWSFEVIMDTHSAELNEDLTQVSILMDENGNEYKSVKWEGDPLGGHHRKGILYFGEIKPVPKSIILIIRQVGGVAERKFEWVL